MGQTSDKSQEVNVIKVLRQKRDIAMERWAKIALRVTSSDAYQRASAAVGKPGLVLVAMAREKAEAAMAQILSHANMPSRADVLSLSTRLTHIETALDDLGAALDEMRASTSRAQTPAPAKPAVAKATSPKSRAKRGGKRTAAVDASAPVAAAGSGELEAGAVGQG